MLYAFSSLSVICLASFILVVIATEIFHGGYELWASHYTLPSILLLPPSYVFLEKY
jgi:hypothetical protein